MPIFRYFLFVGATLLGLLMLANWYVPTAPRVSAAADIERPVIRIHSSRRWPAPVQIDTSIAVPQTPPPAPIEQTAQTAPASKPAGNAYAFLPPPESKPAESKPAESKPSGRSRRHMNHLARLSNRLTHRRMVAWQPLWQPWQSGWQSGWQSTW